MLPENCPMCEMELLPHPEVEAILICPDCGVAFTDDREKIPKDLAGHFADFIEVDGEDGLSEVEQIMKMLKSVKDPESQFARMMKETAGKAFNLDPDDELEADVLRLVHEYNMACKDYLMVLLKLQHYATGSPVGGEAARDALTGRINKMIDIQKRSLEGNTIKGTPVTAPRAPFRLVLEMFRACHNELLCYIHEIEDDSHKADSARFN